MTKIVINTCHGGFGLSYKAYMRYAELKGFELYPWMGEIEKRVYKERATLDNPGILVHYYMKPFEGDCPEKVSNDDYFSCRDIARDDPILVRVVQELGNKANGHFGELKVVEIPNDVDWEIEEYDGWETIHEKHRSWG